MNIFITGGLGFVGQQLSRALLQDGHRVTAVDLATDADTFDHPEFHDSRILTTRNLVAALPEGRRTTLCNASAVGYYGNGGEDVLTEDSPPGEDFLAVVSRDWEQEALAAEARGVRVARMRFGIVLDHGGGALATMIPAFRSFVGGSLGSGRQWFPWIHIQDLVAAILFLVESPSLSGPFNCTAPEPVRNEELARTLGHELHRPSSMPVPAFMIKLVLQEFGDVLLSSQRAVPERLIEAGFSFTYPDLVVALNEIMKRWESSR